MAPLFSIIIQLLPSLSTTPKASSDVDFTDSQFNLNRADQQQQQPVGLTYTSHRKDQATDASKSRISTISWGENRLDVFGLAKDNLTHKFWDGHQWGPSGVELEILGNGLATPPVAVTWGADRLDVFGLDDHNVIKHQYWDGTDWQPSLADFENLGGECDPGHSIAASSWGKNRLDVFCKGQAGDLLHQYYDGSQWQPSPGSVESLGGDLQSAPAIVSWGKDRLDVFGVTKAGDVAHLYWDGSQWSAWETFPLEDVQFSKYTAALAATSWADNRLDIYAVGVEFWLYHKYWDGSQWSVWESLGAETMLESVAASSWSANRLDVVVKADMNFYYKFFDGEAWRPDVLGWYSKGPNSVFISNPSVVSWGTNRLEIFGVNNDQELVHQAWVGDSWFPSNTDWEILGSGTSLD